MENLTTFIAKKTIGYWNKEIKFSFTNLIKSISDGVIAYYQSNTIDLIKSSISLIDIIELKKKPEILAYSLIIKSLQQSVLEIVNENVDKLKPNFSIIQNFQDYKEYQELVGEIEELIEKQTLTIGIDFFENPCNLSILDPLTEIIKKWFVIFGLTNNEALNSSRKIKSYYVFFLNDNWRKHGEDNKLILEKIITPFASITKIELEWKYYHSFLQKQVEEPVFDEHFGIKDIFIPLFGYYEKPKISDNTQSEIEKHVVETIDSLNKWLLKTKNPEDTIKVISGGPGSGKSTLAKIYASIVAAENHTKVIYIPLQHLNIKEDLSISIEDYLRESNFLSFNPITEIHRLSSRLLLIFDGLDELSKQGKQAFELAKDFITEIQRKCSNINRSKLKFFVLITGRELSIQNQSSCFRRQNQVLNILPYYNRKDNSYVDKSNYLRKDLRDAWWQKYGELKNLNYNGFPKELKNPNLDEITAQPLLNYLVALTYERNKIKFNEKTNLNEIFSDLIKAVFERQYEKKQHRVISELNLDENNFIRILEEIAISAWHSGDVRTTTIQAINEHIESNNLGILFKEFQLGVQSGIARLLTAFYFRQKGFDADQNKTFEFTHKSFGEYLTSRRIVRLLLLLSKKVTEHTLNPDDGIDTKEALRKIIESFGVAQIDYYMLSFLSNEVKLQSKIQMKKVQDNIISLIEYSLRVGLPIETLSPRPDFKTELCYYKNSLLILFVLLKVTSDYTKKKSKIKWPNNIALGEVLSYTNPQKHPRNDLLTRKDRFYYNYTNNRSMINNCLTNLIIEDCYLTSADLTYSDFSNSELINVTLAGCDLFGSEFINTKFNNVNFFRASLRRCTFKNVVFENAKKSNFNLTKDQVADFVKFEKVIGLDSELMKYARNELKKERATIRNIRTKK